MTTSGKVRTTDGRGKLFESILDTVGDTPAVRINNLGPDEVTIYVKAEFFNPAGSVKDRLALNIVEEAERSGVLRLGQTVVEALSGNTGIGLAMVCAQKGYPLVVVMPESFSVERRKLMRMYGAKVVLTPRAEKAVGAYRKAAELAQVNGWFLARQFETSANADIHESTTAREIVNDFAGSKLDWFVTGYGTGGTLVGVARLLRRERPETRIALSEPVNAQMIGSSVGQPERFRNEEELRRIWSDPDTRKALVEGLAERGFAGEQLMQIRRMIDAEASDLFDVLRYIAFTKAPLKRAERVQAHRFDILADCDPKQADFLDSVLAICQRGRKRTQSREAARTSQREIRQLIGRCP